MKVTKHEGRTTRKILAAMITDPTVCARISSKWEQSGLFASKWENLIAYWCVKYNRKYGKPPNGQLEMLFTEWAESGRAEEECIKSIEKFLSYLSNEHQQEQFASDHILDLAGEHFNSVKIRNMIHLLEADLDRNAVTNAYDKIVDMRKIDLGAGAIARPGHDLELWEAAFANNVQGDLIEFPGDAGIFFKGSMKRDCFVAFMGGEKAGKSFRLLDIAYRSVKQGNRTLFFEVGDMSLNQVMMRFGQRITRRPLKARTCRLPVDYPSKDRPPICKTRCYDTDLTPKQCYDATRELQKGQDLLRIMEYPNTSINVDGITAVCMDMMREDWVPDVCIIDYADILAPPAGMKGEGRDYINRTWMEMRRLSQQLHCLVITATQADAGAYKKKVLDRTNFSEDKRKLGHVSGLIGINSQENDRQHGISRLNWLARREEQYSESMQLYTAGCLDIGCPMIKTIL